MGSNVVRNIKFFRGALKVNKSRGFTLVELLIVIVIISLLAVLSAPLESIPNTWKELS